MTTMNISLPEKMKEFVDGRVEAGHYGTASEYVRDLIRKDSEHQVKERNEHLDALLLEGLKSLEDEGTFEVTDEYWSQLKVRMKAGEFCFDGVYQGRWQNRQHDTNSHSYSSSGNSPLLKALNSTCIRLKIRCSSLAHSNALVALPSLFNNP